MGKLQKNIAKLFDTYIKKSFNNIILSKKSIFNNIFERYYIFEYFSRAPHHSTVTDLAKFLGLSGLIPLATDSLYAIISNGMTATNGIRYR